MHIKEPHVTEHRYEQRGLEYTLRSWRSKGETTITAAMADRPLWLTQIIDLAIVGGHTHAVPIPPPDVIVWFRTLDGIDLEVAPNGALTAFIDFTNT